MEIINRVLGLLSLTLLSVVSLAQSDNVILEGYIFEDNNSGYLNEVKVSVLDAETSLLYGKPATNMDGYFAIEVPRDKDFIIRANKPVFETAEGAVSSKGLAKGADKIFIKMPMSRAPGYRLEVTLAQEGEEDQDEVDAIQNSLIEVYNNTRNEEVLTLKQHPTPYFSFALEQGNHYTLLIRSPGYFTKRIESFVNVDGCILCMDGVSEIGPGVSDNLAYGNDVGTLLANIDLKPLRVDSAITLDNIYYSYNKAEIRPDAAFELDKVVEMLKVNPSIIVELGSHTDSRGDTKYNRQLSQERAQSAVNYILDKGIDRRRLSANGYGESKLVNKCGNGTECDETEHSRNRRTELKITGFTNDPFLGKPLVDIIHDENLEELLGDVLNAGEYRAPEGGVASVGKSAKKPNAIDAAKAKYADEMASATNVDDDAVASISNAPILEAEPAKRRTSTTTSGAPLSVIVPEQTITNVRPAQLPTGSKFSGYRVLVFQSPTSLADENGELFFKYGTLREEELNGDTFGYMSGSFGSEIEARSYIDNVKTLFPQARMLRYVNGYIIENVE